MKQTQALLFLLLVIIGMCLNCLLAQNWKDLPPPPPRGTPYYNRGGNQDRREPYNNREDSRHESYGPTYKNNDNIDRRFPSYNEDVNNRGGYKAPTRHSVKDYGDKRCPSAVTDNLELDVSVEILGSSVINGKYVYLCDGPEVPEHNRPKPGRAITYFYRNISVFLGIPYAEAPTYENNLRFKPPQVKTNLAYINADQYKPACPQHSKYYGYTMGIDRVNEDCLYLNVFSPTVKQGINTRFPVMIYIHGGDWDHGSANTFPPHMLVASQEVVVVTLNYRLGALGFLATSDPASPGNYGILDQNMAIQWIYERIEYFNGDPNRMVLFGPGAGAASAGLHMLSPRSSDVVRGVIAQSGSALADWAFISDPSFMYNASRIFGQAVGCTTHDSYELVECLRSRSIADLMNVDKKPEVGWLLWGPVLDNVTAHHDIMYFKKTPDEILDENPRFQRDFSYMAGVTRDEAVTMLLEDDELKRNRYVITREFFTKKIKAYMKMYNYTLNPEAVFNAINFMYTDYAGPDNATLLRQGYIDMLSDSYIKAPNDKLIKKLLAKGVKTYMYVLNYTMEGRQLPEWQGVPHNTEYALVTGAPFMDHEFYPPVMDFGRVRWTEADRNMSLLLMQTWSNFAKMGNPTPQALFNTILWEPMALKNLQYLSINTTNLTSVMLRDYRQKECQFWSEYLPTLIDKIMPTFPPIYEPWERREKRIYTSALYGMVGAAGLFIILTFICCCLYCRAKSKHLVEDEYIPHEITTPESYLRENLIEDRQKFAPEVIFMNDAAQKHTRV